MRIGKLLRLLPRLAAGIVLGLSLGAGSAGAATASRSSGFQYHATTGLLTKEIVEPGTAALRVETTYGLDAFGNRTSATVSGSGVASRTATTLWSGDGRFPVEARNPLNHVASQGFDARFGGPSTVTDANGLTATVSYDGFGRKVLEVAPDGTRVRYQYLYCAGTAGGTQACPAQARYLVVSTPLAADGTTQIGPWTRSYHDPLNRAVRTESQGFAVPGAPVPVAIADVEYDERGRVRRQSEPYYAGETVLWTSSTYDILDRPMVVTAPDGSQTATVYGALTTVATNAKGQVQVIVKNSQGQVVRSTDALGSVTRFEYDPFGNLVQTIDPAGNRIKVAYDVRGRRTQLNDPDLGLRTWSYDVLGQVTQEKDAKNQTVSYSYDLLGRVLTRTEPDLTTTWVYDTAAKGIGKPARVSTNTGYQQVFSYDSLGRDAAVAETLEAGVTATGSQTYDAHGRVATVTAPGGQVLSYVYTALSQIHEIRNGATGGVIWRVEEADAQGNLTRERYGNNISTLRTFDPQRGTVTEIRSRTSTSMSDNVQNLGYGYDVLGNLTGRVDWIQGTQENFGFDALNRLTASQVAGFNAQTVAYDVLGNITSKSDTGSYVYGAAGSARPHAVMRINGLPNTLTPNPDYNLYTGLLETVSRLLRILTGTYVPPPGAADFVYDANGNMVWGNGRTVTWSSFDMPLVIKRGTVEISFAYGAGHQRIRQVKSNETIHYFGGGLSERVRNAATGAVTWTTYVSAGGRLVASLSREDAGAPSTAIARYFHVDHLGSVDTVTDEFGAVTERLDFDAWGKRRHGTGAADTASGSIVSAVRKGYTGHEQLDGVGLVHMNGRVYDPLVARFASADPVLQAPLNLQSYNRYAYVLNNPLSYTDPTGYSWVSKFVKGVKHLWKEVLKIGKEFRKFVFSKQGLSLVVGLALTAFLGPTGLFGVSAGLPGIAAAAISGAAAGAISTGTLKGAIIGAVSAAVTYQIGHAWFEKASKFGGNRIFEKTVAHGLAQGTIAEISGGDFKDGFVGAAFSYAVGATVLDNLVPANDNSFGQVLARGAAETIIGGTAAVVGGGKFANGAYSAAFVFAFNQAAGGGRGNGRGGTLRRGGAVDSLAPVREVQWSNLISRLRELEPNNRELTYVTSGNWTPSNNDIARLQQEVFNAEGRLSVIRNIDNGGPFPYPRDGTVFNNRENILPSKPLGYYREYTVPTIGLTTRGAQRLVGGQSGEIYYTPDHYGSFVKIR